MASWYRRLFGKKTIHPVEPESAIRAEPLREFVYLDEVSLRSLLSSQTGGVTDSISEQEVGASVAELEAKLASDAVIAKSELKSRFQTSNSSTLQTSRKATVQSWFREFYNKPGLRLIDQISETVPFVDAEDVQRCQRPSVALSSKSLNRGSLVEFKVKLSADRVFHIGTLVSEFVGMAKDHPRIFAVGKNASVDVEEVEAIGKILQWLLAGLIPIRGEAVDYCVIEVCGTEYVAHKAAVANLHVEAKPLVIVGVTDHLAYWKDIRRVLFSEAEFTILGRISKTGLQETWMPVKLADLMKEVAPDIASQISSASRRSFNGISKARKETPNEHRLGLALHHYASSLLTSFGKSPGQEELAVIYAKIEAEKGKAETVSGQRSAFASIGSGISVMVAQEPDPELDASLRERARISSGLSLFPFQAETVGSSDQEVEASDLPGHDERLLDVEIVAMYW